MNCKNIFKNLITTSSNKRGGEPFLPMMSLKVIPPLLGDWNVLYNTIILEIPCSKIIFKA
jgi:hypothetical protein